MIYRMIFFGNISPVAMKAILNIPLLFLINRASRRDNHPRNHVDDSACDNKGIMQVQSKGAQNKSWAGCNLRLKEEWV